MSAEDMVQILAANRQIRPFLKTFNLTLNKGRPAPKGVDVHAKTGTLNYVSSLAGFITPKTGRPLCFAIFGADTERRDAIPKEARHRPPGARGWARRSRQLQKELIRGWVEQYT
jgi:D-alanyl-D-alanine carboxypeptidase/D-alanyl-D-alanine-endopeptidase (penicillin-binding protein 4)